MRSSTPRPIIWFPPPGISGTGASFGGGRLGGNFAVITGVVPITVGPIGGALYSGALQLLYQLLVLVVVQWVLLDLRLSYRPRHCNSCHRQVCVMNQIIHCHSTSCWFWSCWQWDIDASRCLGFDGNSIIVRLHIYSLMLARCCSQAFIL